MAAGAEELLDSATVVATIEEAVADCSVVAATSVRPRDYDLPCVTPNAAADLLVQHSDAGRVALLFGPERMGLHNQDLKHARYRVQIPANPNYPSLNLASAVQILTYEIYQHAAPPTQAPDKGDTRELPTSASLEHLHVHLEAVLRQIKFLRPHEGETLERLRNFIHRAEPEVIDVNILRGILNAVEKNNRAE